MAVRGERHALDLEVGVILHGYKTERRESGSDGRGGSEVRGYTTPPAPGSVLLVSP